MNEFVPFPPPAPVEGLSLVGFRIDPASPVPQFYTVFALEGENDRPAMSEGRILFFTRTNRAGAAVAASENGLRELGAPPAEVDILCDIAESLFIANSQKSDEDGVLLDCIACLDDLVRATQLSVPADYMTVLSALSVRLLENPEFGSWVEEQGIDRERIEDAIMWCVGAVGVKSRWL